ncbi:MAG: phosphomethylpyrimidine synthase ThiC, partial [Promethearchaeota archaeon]
MTLLEDALKKNKSENLTQVALEEHVDVRTVIKAISKGSAVVIQRTNSKAVGIGYPFRTKINVNLGTSSSIADIDEELKKVKVAEKFGADTISDLSMGGDIDLARRKIIDNSTVPITTVPIYQALVK